ncbi:hypothetical protein IEQ34_003387 [Dendrobium chrysotoxum]|uniref:Uncharacterized protein n=1 Tax=Dendrobium chrysotoxum TaxID=161865 RepID=A0AAV7HJI6_DENCH|nr:hypothetical protein IEQ34_003387 [Dendrobium chrysotoxum]
MISLESSNPKRNASRHLFPDFGVFLSGGDWKFLGDGFLFAASDLGQDNDEAGFLHTPPTAIAWFAT